MRENRSSGSEGGVALIPPSLPLSNAGARLGAPRRAWGGQMPVAAIGFGEPPKPTGQRLVLPIFGQPQRGCGPSAQAKSSVAQGRRGVQSYVLISVPGLKPVRLVAG